MRTGTTSVIGPLRRFARCSDMSGVRWIVLQNSKVAAPRIFRENKKRETITNSYTLSRGAEIAGEFNARGSVPSRLYTEDAPTARRIFDHLCKTTFATQSDEKRKCFVTSKRRRRSSSGSLAMLAAMRCALPHGVAKRNPKRVASRAWGPKRDDGLERVTNRRTARRPSEHASPDGSIAIGN